MKWLILIVLTSTILACSKTKPTSESSKETVTYSEQYRPQFHFSPAKNWTNDPNGLVYYEGEYHIFFQYNPYGTVWGHMSWGHAVSKDLLHWEQLPVALSEYQDRITGDSTMIFSGTVVVDKNNSSGLCSGPECMVAIYTSHVHKNGEGILQHQSLAYSNDKGRTWISYDKNPVLSIDRKDFRDPKIFWDNDRMQWVMLAVIPDKFTVQFYKSTNLKEWSLMSEFSDPQNTSTKIWECPDLYQMPVADEPGKMKWVLSLSRNGPAHSYSEMLGYIGEYDGTRFTASNAFAIDKGKDYYAGITVNNMPKEDGRTVMIAWANNWAYGNLIPTAPWRGAMAFPRELSLRNVQHGDTKKIQLFMNPIKELESLRGKELTNFDSIDTRHFELEMIVNTAKMEAPVVGLLKAEGKNIVEYNVAEGKVFFNRTDIGVFSSNQDYATLDVQEVLPGKEIKFRILVDDSIVEIFVNDGEYTMCEQVFLKSGSAFSVPNKDGEGLTVKGWSLKSVWR
ncbi:levanase [soil metagenome]